MKKLLALGSFAALTVVLAFPSASFAATYEFVTNEGVIASISANSAEEAILKSGTPDNSVGGPGDRDPRSGVLLIQDSEDSLLR